LTNIDTSQSYYGPDVVNDLIREGASIHIPRISSLVTTGGGARRDEAGGVLPAQQPDELRAGVEAEPFAHFGWSVWISSNLRLVRHRTPKQRPYRSRRSLPCARGDAPGRAKLDLIGLSNCRFKPRARLALESVDVAEIQKRLQQSIDRQDDEMVEFAPAERDDRVRAVALPLGLVVSGAGRRDWPGQKPQIVGGPRTSTGATPTQIALAWVCSPRYERMLLIPGTSSMAAPRGEHGLRPRRSSFDDAGISLPSIAGLAERPGRGMPGRTITNIQVRDGSTWGPGRSCAPWLR